MGRQGLNTDVRCSPKGRTDVCAALIILLGVALGAAGCGGERASSTASTTVACKPPPKDPRAALDKLKMQSNEILDCGTSGFKHQLEALKGYPVVVNKWASWCGPCRFEFPFFKRVATRHVGKIAFLGVDAEDAKGDAKKFLKKFPIPYPSFFDPRSNVATVFRGQRVFPASAFYNRRGELVLTKQGGYASEAALENDIARYSN
jgi:cytochrome c biogenesis protein CcmG, thiol:disulfide interchange protein DsbE